MQDQSDQYGPLSLMSAQVLSEAAKIGIADRLLLAEGIEKCAIPFFIIDNNHQIVIWNDAIARLTGHPRAKMVGTPDHWRAFYSCRHHTLADLIVDEVSDCDVPIIYSGKFRKSTVLEHGYEVVDFFPDIGDNGLWLFFTAAPLKTNSGEIVGAIETLHDITTWEHAKRAIEEDHFFLSQVVCCNSIATFVINREHQVTHWNKACELVTGYLSCDIVGTSDQWRPFYAEKRPVMADIILTGASGEELTSYYHESFKASTIIAGAFEAEGFFPLLGPEGKWLYLTAAPLLGADGQLIGAIETIQDFTDQKMLETELRVTQETYRMLSITDGLTGLYNSRHFYEVVGAESDRSSRHNAPLALLMMDIDNFKSINDTFGHTKGDFVLKEVSHIIRSVMRKYDMPFRYGGEEYAVLLPNTNCQIARAIGERIRRKIENADINLANDHSSSVTVSIGVSELGADYDIRNFIERADHSLYRAKNMGKNCVIASYSHNS